MNSKFDSLFTPHDKEYAIETFTGREIAGATAWMNNKAREGFILNSWNVIPVSFSSTIKTSAVTIIMEKDLVPPTEGNAFEGAADDIESAIRESKNS